MTRLKDIPQLQANGANLKEVAEAVREVLQTFRGYRGDKLDRALTLRDLDAATARAVLGGGTVGGGGNTVILPGGGGGGGDPYEPDLTAPPTPEGLAVSAGIGHIFVECDTPTYTQGHGHDRTVVYGAKWADGDPEPTFADAVELFQFQGTFSAYPSDPATTWCIWIKWRSIDGVLSASPAGGTNGQQTTTGQDVALLLEALTGAITESQLFGDLGDRIDLIDGSMPGSVNARVAAKSKVFVQADTPSSPSYGDLWIDVRQNLVLYSEQFNNAAWQKLNVTVAANNVNDVNGNLLADRLTCTSSFGAIFQSFPNYGTSQPFSYSIDLRAGSSMSVTMVVQVNDGVDSTDTTLVVALTTSWQRFTLSGTTTKQNLGIQLLLTSGQVVYVARAALEKATEEGAYITTTNAPSPPTRTMLFWNGAAWAAAEDVRIGQNAAAIISEGITRATEDEALATQIDAVVAVAGSNTAAITAEATARASADTALASSITTLTATVGTNTAAILAEATARADADTAISTTVSALTATVDDNTAAILAEETARADADTAIASSVTTLAATVAGNTAAISSEASTRATADSAMASQITTIQATLTDPSTGLPAAHAAVSTEASARASETGALFAKYTVKVDVNGYVSGFGLASTANNSAPTSSFQVRADSFAISSPTGPGITPVTPFVVQTTPGTVNGVSVPVGVYMDAAYIKNGTITTAKIGDAQIDNAKIANLSAAKITAGSLQVGSYVRSSVYTSGSAGWAINADGTAEFSGVIVRGTVYASAGQIGGITIAGAAVRAGQSDYNTGAGFWLGADGRFSLGNSSGSRLTWDGTNLNVVGGGTFSGALSAASGTFTGNMSAGQFTTGAMTGPSWPASGTYGTFLGPYGLLMGNYNDGKWVEITAEGNIVTPGFSVVNGVMTVLQANVIDTLNIAGGAVSASPTSSGTGTSIDLPVTVPSGQTHRITMVCVQNGGGSSSTPLAASSVSCNGITVPVHAGSVGSTGGDNDSTLWGYNSTTLAFTEELTGPTSKTYTFAGLSGYGKVMTATVLKK